MKQLTLMLLILFTTIAWAVYALFIALYRSSSIGDAATIGVMVGTLIGIVLGICYWLALRLWNLKAVNWAPATILGWGVGGMLGGAISFVMDAAFYADPLTDDIYGIGLGAIGLVVGAVTGAVVSVCQWLVGRSWMAYAWQWVVITTVGWAVAGLTAWFIGVSVGAAIASVTGWVGWAFYLPVGLIIGVSAGGAVVAAATAIGLYVMLHPV